MPIPAPVVPETTMAGCVPVLLSTPAFSTKALLELAGETTVANPMPLMSTGSKFWKLTDNGEPNGPPLKTTLPLPAVEVLGV